MDGSATEKVRAQTDVLVANSAATYEHFRPLENGRDRFGNRIFQSTEKAYLTRREQTPVKAAMLVSAEGEAFIKTNPGILRDIDQGLSHIGPTLAALPRDAEDVHINPINLGIDRKLSYLGKGSSSFALLLESGKEKSVIKVRNTGIPEYESFYQPYINEALQLQSLQTDLHDGLGKLGIRLPVPLFASGQVECVRFEEGDRPSPDEIRKLTNSGELSILVQDYIDQQRKQGNTLWNNISIDLVNPQHLIEGRTDNFIKSPDGTLVWIDPLTYFPSFTGVEVLKMKVADGDQNAARILKEFFPNAK